MRHPEQGSVYCSMVEGLHSISLFFIWGGGCTVWGEKKKSQIIGILASLPHFIFYLFPSPPLPPPQRFFSLECLCGQWLLYYAVKKQIGMDGSFEEKGVCVLLLRLYTMMEASFHVCFSELFFQTLPASQQGFFHYPLNLTSCHTSQ